MKTRIKIETRSRRWPHHLYKPWIPPAAVARPFSSLILITAAAAHAGLTSGIIEVAIQTGRHAFLGAESLGSLQLNRHFLWMIPLTNMALFLLGTAPLAVVSLARPEFARRASRYLLIYLTSLSLLSIVRGIHWLALATFAAGIAYRLAPVLSRRSERARRLMLLSFPGVIGIVAALGFLSYDQAVLKERRMIAGLPAADPRTPNVLLVVLDTMRGDRLSDSSSQRQTTPNLAALAERGVRFREARSAAPWTFPSHASLFTGRWPHELKLGTGRPLDGTYPTLAEVLSSQGYSTAGFVANTYYCNSWFGLGRGFAHYEDYYDKDVSVSLSEAIRTSSLGHKLLELTQNSDNIRAGDVSLQKTAEQVTGHFLDWVSKKDGHPFFAFLNYIDIHDPYVTPSGFENRFGHTSNNAVDLDFLRSWHLSNKQSMTQKDIEFAIDSYDDCVAYVDEQLGRLFDELERKGILDNTLVIITADHGEGFGEHSQFLHGKCLYREETHVPLIMFGPTGIPRNRQFDQPVSLRDVATTVVDRLGLGANSPFPGRSMARFWERPKSGDPPAEEPILSEVEVVDKVSKNPNRAPAYRGPMASMILDGHLYIRDAVGREELFDIKNDPGEKANLAGKPEKASLLKRCRETYEREVPESHDRSRKRND